MLNLGRCDSAIEPGPPVLRWAGVGTCALPETGLATPQPAPSRLPYHLLALTTAGHGTVEVDFATQICRPGTLLWIRPGQATRFGGQPGLDAALVTWERGLLPVDQLAGVAVDDPTGHARWQLAGEDEDAVINEFAQLAVDCDRHAVGAVTAALLRHQLAVLLLRIALLAADEETLATAAENRTYARFRRHLEEDHPHSRRVEDYAARLGCSVRTLTRASLAVTGRTAKQTVDDRVALEARRLLACTALSVAEIGRRLGFPEPTNFGRFFHRETGVSPGMFRAEATDLGANRAEPGTVHTETTNGPDAAAAADGGTADELTDGAEAVGPPKAAGPTKADPITVDPITMDPIKVGEIGRVAKATADPKTRVPAQRPRAD
jgi:AraC-like DNA-binding protein